MADFSRRRGLRNEGRLHSRVFFGILYGIDATIAAIALYFFAVGLNDGSVSSFHVALWAGILSGIAAILIGGSLLRSYGHQGLAKTVLLVLALPGFLYGVLLLSLIILHPQWN
jgi:hypothetical protein